MQTLGDRIKSNPRLRLWIEIGAVLGIALLGAYTTSRPLLATRSVLQDNVSYDYGLFYDNLHSLNHYGQPAYWLPNKNCGYPQYYWTFIGGFNGTTPCRLVLASTVYALGKLGLRLSDFYGMYMAYTGFLTPVLLSLAVYALGKQIFRSSAVMAYLIVVTAWSPGVLVNLATQGFTEPLAYGLFWFAAWLSFCKHPGSHRFHLLTLATLVCAVSLAATSLLVVLLLAVSFMSTIVPVSAWRRTRRAVRSVSMRSWAAVGLLAIACAWPKLTTYYRARNQLCKPGLSSDRYSEDLLKPGNPLVVLAAGTPNVGFAWNQYQPSARPGNELLPVSVTARGFQSYGYLGILALPLSLFGLLYGRRSLRTRLLVVLVVLFSSAVLASYSPFFALLLALPTPLQSFNHFSDLLFRGGGFVVVLFCAACGLEALLRPELANRNRVLWPYWCCAGGSIVLYLAVHWRETTCLGSIFGFLLFMTAAFSVALTRVAMSTRAKEIQGMSAVLLFLVAIDVGTVAHYYGRHVYDPSYPLLRKISGQIALGGLGAADDVYGYARYPLVVKRLDALRRRGLQVQALPSLALYAHARIVDEVTQEDIRKAVATGETRSLGLVAPPLSQSFGLGRFMEGARAGVADAPGTFRANWSNYNTLQVDVDARQECLLFIRNVYFPGWTALVNGDEAPIFRALEAFQAVPVPAGQSKVVLRFWPKYEVLTLWLAYGILAVWTCLTLRSLFRTRYIGTN